MVERALSKQQRNILCEFSHSASVSDLSLLPYELSRSNKQLRVALARSFLALSVPKLRAMAAKGTEHFLLRIHVRLHASHLRNMYFFQCHGSSNHTRLRFLCAS